MSTAKEYKLYACAYSRENEEKFSERRFCRINAEYMLIYDDVPATGANEVSNDMAPDLPFEDKLWLLNCNTQVLAEDAKRREAEISRAAEKAIKELGKQLDKSKEEVK